MDSLYLRRFNSATDLETLQDEMASLSSQENDYSQEFLKLCDSMSYSEAQRLASKLASVRAKYSYITRMIEKVRQETERSRQYLFQADYYGSLDDQF